MTLLKQKRKLSHRCSVNSEIIFQLQKCEDDNIFPSSNSIALVFVAFNGFMFSNIIKDQFSYFHFRVG